MKKLSGKYREIILYLVFGVLTTVVGWIVYYGILFGGRAVLQIPSDEVTGTRYITVYTIAQVLQWICAVVFAFITNKKWVFTKADKEISTTRQFGTFAASRFVTFVLDYIVTFAGTLALGAIFPGLVTVFVLGKERNLCEILSKVAAAVIVIICNYVISKLFVFKSNKKDGSDKDRS